MEIGALLKKAREDKRLSQQEVAHRLNTTQKTISNIESEKSKPTIEQLAVLGEIYDVDILDILSQQGITFHQNNQRGGENGIINHFHYPESLLKMCEKQLSDKEEIILLLRAEIARLNKTGR